MFINEHPWTFNYGPDDTAVSFNCGCRHEHEPYCDIISQRMVDWMNNLHITSRVRVSKRDTILRSTS